MNKGDTAVLSARVHKEKQTDVIWKSNGEIPMVLAPTTPSSALASYAPITVAHLLPSWSPVYFLHHSKPFCSNQKSVILSAGIHSQLPPK